MDLQTFEAAKKLNDARVACLIIIEHIEKQESYFKNDTLGVPVEVAGVRLYHEYLPITGDQIVTLYVDNIKRKIEWLELELSKL